MKTILSLSLLLALGLWLRLWGIGFGMPIWSNLYIRPDETLLVVPAVELFARHGYPGHMDYPALLIQVLGIWFQAVHAGFSLLGSAHGSILDDFSANPTRYFIAGRVVSACCGAASILVIFRLAKRWCSGFHAATAAAWYAVCTLAVRESHFAVTDTALSLLVACTVLAAVRYFEVADSQRRRAVIWCGCLCGTALATKYVAGILVPALALAFLAGGPSPRWADRVRDILIFLALSLGVFLLLNPWLLFHPGALLDRFSTLFRAIYLHRPQAAAGTAEVWGLRKAWIYLGFLPGRWLGLLFAVVGLVSGLAACKREWNGQLIALLAAVLAYTAMLAPADALPFRYLAPLLPLLAVLAGIGMEMSMPHLKRVPRASLAVSLLGIAGTLPATIQMDRSLAREDTRSEAGRWIKAHVPAPVPVVWLGEPESEPQWHESAASIQRRIWYVENRYGFKAARVIDRPYLLIMQGPKALGAEAREVYRNPEMGDVPHSALCVVQADYPLPMVISDQQKLLAWTPRQATPQAIIGPSMEERESILDPTDAWFLPMNLTTVIQPGPRLRIYLIDRSDP